MEININNLEPVNYFDIEYPKITSKALQDVGIYKNVSTIITEMCADKFHPDFAIVDVNHIFGYSEITYIVILISKNGNIQQYVLYNTENMLVNKIEDSIIEYCQTSHEMIKKFWKILLDSQIHVVTGYNLGWIIGCIEKMVCINDYQICKNGQYPEVDIDRIEGILFLDMWSVSQSSLKLISYNLYHMFDHFYIPAENIWQDNINDKERITHIIYESRNVHALFEKAKIWENYLLMK